MDSLGNIGGPSPESRSAHFSILLVLGMFFCWFLLLRSAAAQEPLLSLPAAEPALSSSQPASAPPSSADLEKRVRDLEELVNQLKKAPPKEKSSDTASKTAKKEGDKTEAKETVPSNPTIATFEVGKDTTFKVLWKDGFYAETADKAFSFHIGGRWDFDNTWYGSPHATSTSIGQFNNFADPNTGLTDGVDMRRARVRMDVTFYEVMEAVSEIDFANYLDNRRRTLGIGAGTDPNSLQAFDFDPASPVRFTDMYLGFKDLPFIGTLKAGHQKEFLTMSNATSARYMTFIERPMVFEAFNGDYQFTSGITAAKLFLDERLLVWTGMFRNNNVLTNGNNNGAFDVGDGDYAYDLRVTGLPIWLDDGNCYVHVGGAYSYRNLHQDTTRLRAFPLVRAGSFFQVPSIINTGVFYSRDAQQIYHAELAMAWGPLTITSEWSGSTIGNTFTGSQPLANGKLPKGAERHGDYFANGVYVEALYFLTGDHRPYRREQGGYDRIHPEESFFLVPGPFRHIFGRGAWEVGLRYDYLDLSNHGINGGMSNGLTAGLNWHLNPNARVMWNYVYQTRSFSPPDQTGRRDGDFNGFGMRFHWDF